MGEGRRPINTKSRKIDSKSEVGYQMDAKKAKEIYRIAAKISDSLPEKYQQQAFLAIYTKLLAEMYRKQATDKKNPENAKSVKSDNNQEEESKLDLILSNSIDYSEYRKTLIEGTWEDRSIVILYVVGQVLDIQGLTAPEFAAIMEKQIGLPQVHRQNIYRALKTSKYFIKSRLSDGKTIKYELSILGKERVDKLSIRS